MTLHKVLPTILLFCILSSVQAQSNTVLPTDFDVQGHRGARGLKPENTLPSFEIALDLGVTTLELDLHFTSDEVVVIWHDDHIDSDLCRLDADSTVEAPDPDSGLFQGDNLMISNLTWEQIQAYRCDRNPDEVRFPEQDNAPTQLAGDDYHIPSLEELFIFVEQYAESDEKTEVQRQNAATVHFNIETKRKSDPDAIGDDFDGINAGTFELAILDIIANYEFEERVTIQSFDHRSIWAVHSENENISLAALTSNSIPDFDELVERGASIWSPNFRDLTPTLLQDAQDTGLLVIPWTINDVDVMLQWIELGVDGIITDRPDILLSLESE